MSLGNSLFFYQNDKSPYLEKFSGYWDEINALEELGVICVASAGNDYAGRSEDFFVVFGSGESDFRKIDANTSSVQGVGTPAAFPNVISVRATWASDEQGLSSRDAKNQDH